MAGLIRQVPLEGESVCDSPTKFHIEGDPLREDNFEEYTQREHRKTIKRRLSQENNCHRKQMRHRMALDDLPRHHNSDEDADVTQM
ncbi:hypothetical protein GN244_ATG20857 [Phytophthora infestans]|uniref:Uncharacterized protein n=1 Tax=Phytophthora infestans TaxID=4787 RepID=A0A833SF37_PHYIN|nr:hypothetical protein GN244_ATG20857 [Phytophthora infestans]